MRSRLTSPTLTGLALTLASGAPLLAQGLPVIPHDPDDDVPWPLAEAGFTSAVAGRFVFEDMTSAWVLASGEACLMVNPRTYTSISRLQDLPVELADGTPVVAPGTFHDLAVLRDGVAVGQDSLLAVGDAGLFEYALVPDDQDPDEIRVVQTALEAGPWLGVKALTVVDVDLDGYEDVLGIDASGYAIVRKMGQASGFASSYSFIVPYPAFDVVALDYWELGQARDIVALTDDGLYFYDATGAYLREIRMAHPGGAIAVVDADGAAGGAELLAWIVREAGDEFWWLHCFNGAQGFDSPPVDLRLAHGPSAKDIAVVGLDSGDFDGDGLDDLAVRQQTYRSVPVFLNTGTAGAHFTANTLNGDLVWVDLDQLPEATAPTHEAQCAFLEPRGDEEVALLVPFEEERRVSVVEYQDGAVGALSGPLRFRSYFGTPSGSSTETLFVAFDDISVYSSYAMVEVVVWRQEGETEDVDPDSILRAHYDLPDPENPPVDPPGAACFDYVAVQLPSSLSWSDEGMIHYVQVRFVNLDFTGQAVVSGSDEHILAFASGEFLDYLTNEELRGEHEQLELGGGCGGVFETSQCFLYGSSRVDVIVVQEFIPPFPNGQVPHPGTGVNEVGSVEHACEAE